MRVAPRRSNLSDPLRASEADMMMPRVCLCVRKSNQPAIALYTSEGYHSSDLWKRYYEDGEDAIVMEKQLRAGQFEHISKEME